MYVGGVFGTWCRGGSGVRGLRVKLSDGMCLV